ncbi:PRAME family member 8-like [Dama dama]|uniref:PRAME family member 8-like n=1 Tax=Dama dama TaxID=30532 RepID=UPI002A36C5FF|nr:PRAME family member 8-like [Dama dama]
MSVQNPLRLLNLAGKTLLTNEALAISALEYLPIELFPPLFMEAFCGRHRKTLKALVQAWPFVRLPLGGLMQTPHVVTLQAVLEGLDVLLTQKDRPRRCKLRVLDLRNTGQDFWRMWSGSSVHVSSSFSVAPGAEDRSSTETVLAPFEVFIELHLKERSMDGFLICLMRWVEQRKASIHLCCKRLRILSFSMDKIMRVLSMVQLDCIQEVYMNRSWHLSTLAMFAPLLGQMSNLQRLLISHINLPDPEEQEEHHIVKITSQFLRLHHLRDLHLESPFYLKGCLDQMLRCLMTPLDNLGITRCLLTDSDLTHLCQSPNISQLKGLYLSGVTMTYSSPELLPALLEKVSATLQELYLEQCGIRDSHLESILHILSRCFQLMSFSLRGNLLSMAIMEKLLRNTSGLPRLSKELYPAPQESFSSDGILQPRRLAQSQTELLEILEDLGHPRTIWIIFTPLSTLRR